MKTWFIDLTDNEIFDSEHDVKVYQDNFGKHGNNIIEVIALSNIEIKLIDGESNGEKNHANNS